MNQGTCSMRQLMTLVVVALLSPAIRLLPGQSAMAGDGGWLSTLITLPVALLVGWMFVSIFRTLPGGMGLVRGYQWVWGKWVAKGVALLYIGWGLLLLVTYTRLSGVRLMATGYETSPLIFLVTVLVVTVGWLVAKGLAPILRTGQIFFLVLAVVVAFTLILSLPQMEGQNILPIWMEDGAQGLAAAYYPVTLLGLLTLGGCAVGGVTLKEGDGKVCLWWLGGLWLTLTAIQLAVMATFGSELVATMDNPFFAMSRGISVEGAFQRVEAVVVALWVLSDLAFLVMAAYGTVQAFLIIGGERWERVAHWVVPGLVWLGALGLVTDQGVLEWLEYTVLPLCSVVLGLLFPGTLWIFLQMRKKEKKGVDKGV